MRSFNGKPRKGSSLVLSRVAHLSLNARRERSPTCSARPTRIEFMDDGISPVRNSAISPPRAPSRPRRLAPLPSGAKVARRLSSRAWVRPRACAVGSSCNAPRSSKVAVGVLGRAIITTSHFVDVKVSPPSRLTAPTCQRVDPSLPLRCGSRGRAVARDRRCEPSGYYPAAWPLGSACPCCGGLRTSRSITPNGKPRR